MANKEIEIIMEKVRKMLGFAPEDYEITRLNKKMADCITETKKIIRKPDIRQYDRETIEYILVHEFCHLQYKTHCQGYHQMLFSRIKNIKKYEQMERTMIF